jgi:hypothetical protein
LRVCSSFSILEGKKKKKEKETIMIEYESGGPMGGLQNLIRIHGSAAYKCVVPALLSTWVLLGYEWLLYNEQEQRIDAVDHPNAIGAFVAFFSFLLTFRCVRENINYGFIERTNELTQKTFKTIVCRHQSQLCILPILGSVFHGISNAIQMVGFCNMHGSISLSKQTIR